jgi:hypothetical protein
VSYRIVVHERTPSAGKPRGITDAPPGPMTKQTETTTDALELLTDQHAEVDALIAAIENDEGDRGEQFIQLADKIAAHATIEEKLFYPSVLTDETRELLQEAVEEHLSVKRLLADMLEIEVDSEEFDAKLTVLKEQFDHHSHREEEGKLFPILERTLSADDRAALGNELLVMFDGLMEEEPRRNVPMETDAPAPLPL